MGGLFLFLSVAGIIVGVVFLAIAIFQDKKWEFSTFGGYAAIAVAFFVVFGSLGYFGMKIEIGNHFYNMHEEYKEAVVRVEVMEEKADVLQGQLLDLLDRYVEHESELIQAVKGRSPSMLLALFEQYPALRASENVTQVTKEYVALIEDIAVSKAGIGGTRVSESSKRVEFVSANEIARKYNAAARRRPETWFMPGDVPKELPLLSTS